MSLKEDPTLVLAEALFLSEKRRPPSDAILSQEARGQAKLATACVLPWCQDRDDDEVLLAWGFVLGEPVEADPIFRQATLPPGWSKRPTSHSMWTDIIDGLGRVRVSMFYKAAFYDRSADMSPASRYRVDLDWAAAELGNGRCVVQRQDGDSATGDDGFTEIHVIKRPIPARAAVDLKTYYADRDSLTAEASRWLREMLGFAEPPAKETYLEQRLRKQAELLAEWEHAE